MFRYVLRDYIDPGFAEEKRIAELVRLCRSGRIEEVMLFYNPEELSRSDALRVLEAAYEGVSLN